MAYERYGPLVTLNKTLSSLKNRNVVRKRIKTFFDSEDGASSLTIYELWSLGRYLGQRGPAIGGESHSEEARDILDSVKLIYDTEKVIENEQALASYFGWCFA